MLGNFKNYSDYIPSKRQLRAYADYDLDDVLKAIGLERRNVGLDVLGFTTIFFGGALLGAVIAAFWARPDLVDKAKRYAKTTAEEYGVTEGTTPNV